MERLKFYERAQAHRFARDVAVACPPAPRESIDASKDIWAGLETGHHVGADDAASPTRHDALVELARSLRTVTPEGAAPSDFKAALRQRLLTDSIPAHAEAGYEPSSRSWGLRWSQGRRWVAAAALGLTLSGTAGTAMASESALPGQTLYPVKRKLEQVRVTLAWDDATRGKLYVNQANERLDEAETLAQQPGAASNPALKATVQDLLNAADASSRQAQLAPPEQAAATQQELTSFIQQSAPRLDALKQTMQAQPSLANSLDALTRSATTTANPGSSPDPGHGAGSGSTPMPPPVVSPPTTDTPASTPPSDPPSSSSQPPTTPSGPSNTLPSTSQPSTSTEPPTPPVSTPAPSDEPTEPSLPSQDSEGSEHHTTAGQTSETSEA